MKRAQLPDEVFGIPQERKYPMPDERHTISAIKLFNHVEDKYEEQLAKAIIKNMKKYNIDGSMIGDNNRLKKYLPKDMVTESSSIQYISLSKKERSDIITITKSLKDPWKKEFDDIYLEKIVYKKIKYYSGIPIGFVIIRAITKDNENKGSITVAVSPNHEGENLGYILLKEAIAFYDKCSFLDSIEYRVAKNNKRSITLVNRLGFTYISDKDGYQIYNLNKNMISESVIVEGLLSDDKDIYYNKDKFDSGEINLCFITGLSGSGKSTMGKNMQNSKVEHYEMDYVICNDALSDDDLKKYGNLIYSFFKGPGKDFRLSHDNEDHNKVVLSNNENYEKEVTQAFVKYALLFCKSHKSTKYVCDGIWIFMFIEPSMLKDCAVYIKGTSSLKSGYRALRRDIIEDKSKGMTFLQIFKYNFSRIKYDVLYAGKDSFKLKQFRKFFTKESLMTEASDTDIYSIINMQKELAKFEYGVPINGKIKKVSEIDFGKEYKTLTDKEFYLYKAGVCWDFANYQEIELSEIYGKGNVQNYYFIVDKAPNYPTHTITIVKLDGYYYYPESSWGKMMGVYRDKNISKILNTVAYKLAHEEKDVTYVECRKYNGYNRLSKLSPNEYMNKMNNAQKINVSLKYSELEKVTSKTISENMISESSDIINESSDIPTPAIIKIVKSVVHKYANNVPSGLRIKIEKIDRNKKCMGVLILEGPQEKRDTKEARNFLKKISGDVKDALTKAGVSVKKIDIGDGDEGCIYIYFKTGLFNIHENINENKNTDPYNSIKESTTAGTIVGPNQADSIYIVNYMQNNVFSGHKENRLGICKKGMKDLHAFGGRYNRFHHVSDLDEFKEEASDIKMYKYIGDPKNSFCDIIESTINDLDLYELLTGRNLPDRDFIDYDRDFIREECFLDTLDAIRECTEAGLLSVAENKYPVPILTETVQSRPYNYYRDLDGVFIQHEVTKIRSKSYISKDIIPESQVNAVKRGYLY